MQEESVKTHNKIMRHKKFLKNTSWMMFSNIYSKILVWTFLSSAILFGTASPGGSFKSADSLICKLPFTRPATAQKNPLWNIFFGKTTGKMLNHKPSKLPDRSHGLCSYKNQGILMYTAVRSIWRRTHKNPRTGGTGEHLFFVLHLRL